MLSPHSPKQNHLLAALPSAEYERLAAHLELVQLSQGDVICEPGAASRHVCFPTDSIVSLQYVMESGTSAEISGVGNEGIVGVSVFMGGTMPSSGLVQSAGHAFRLEGRLLKQEFNRGGVVQSLMLRYTQTLMAQMVQTAACNRYHSIRQQFCRWLLLTVDRLDSRELETTQEMIAGMLGVRRESINEAAGHLQQAGLIQSYRGHISVVDRAGLESQVCGCYASIRNEMARLGTDIRRRQGGASPAHGDFRVRPLEPSIPLKAPAAKKLWSPSLRSKENVRSMYARALNE